MTRKYPNAFRYCVLLVIPIISLLWEASIWTLLYLVQGIKENSGTRKMFQEGKVALVCLTMTFPNLTRYFEFLLTLYFHFWKELFLKKSSLFLALILFLWNCPSSYWQKYKCANNIKGKSYEPDLQLIIIVNGNWARFPVRKSI